MDFDKKVEKGRYASVVKNQNFYNEVIQTLEKADLHMKKTIHDASDLLNRVVQVSSDIDDKAKSYTEKIVSESMGFDLTDL